MLEKLNFSSAYDESSVSEIVSHSTTTFNSFENAPSYYTKKRAQTLDRVFKQYLYEKQLTGEPIPIEINHKGYAPDREQICTDIHNQYGVYVDPKSYLYTGWFGEKIKELFLAQLKNEGKNKPSAEEKRLARAKELERQKDFAKILKNFLEELKKSGRKLKFNNYVGGTDNAWISEQTGIPYAHLVKPFTLCRSPLAKARAEIGLENFSTVEEFVLKAHTYRKLLEYGTDCRKTEVETNKNADAQINNTRHALLKFIKINNLTIDSKIGAEFGVRFAESLSTIAATISNPNTKKKFLHEIRKWQKYYSGLLQTDNLPPDFPNALKFLIEASGKTHSEIERLCCFKNRADGKVIGKWVTGTNNPSFKYLPLIHKIEEYFHLPQNTLAGRVSFNGKLGNAAALRKGNFPEVARKQTALVAKYLPNDFPLLPVEEQKQIVAEICEGVIKNTNSYRLRQQQLCMQPYRLRWRDFSPKLIEEIDSFVEFKTLPRPPHGYKRGRKARWKKEDPEKLGTYRFFLSLIESVFGVLTMPQEDGGAGLKVDQLTFTLLILPSTWNMFLNFMQKRYGEMPISTVNRYLGMIYPLLHPLTGWISQSPWLALNLKPATKLISEQEVAEANNNWSYFLQKIDPELKEIYTEYKELHKDAPKTRDSHLPILPILESDSPLTFMRDALNECQKNIPSQHIAPMENATRLRNIIFLRILTETALRLSNMVNLTWNANNSGQLYRADDGHYHITIPHTNFKNSHSSFFGPPKSKHPYHTVLSKTLTPLIDEYLFRCRDYLIERWAKSKRGAGRDTDLGFFFISNPSGINQRLNHQPASIMVHKFSKTYLVYNPLTGTGIKGVESFGPHAVRHIIATHVLKKTGSFTDAAAAIQDSESTVRTHYARYLPSDRDQRFRHLITDMMEGTGE